MNKVVIIGGVSIDTIITIDDLPKLTGDDMSIASDTYQMVGGTGTGKALALKHLGVKDVVLFARIGIDDNGTYIKKYFSKYGIKFIPILSDKPTETHTNIMYNKNDRLSIFTNSEHGDYIFPQSQIKKESKNADMIFANINGYVMKQSQFIKELGKPIFVDLHDYQEGNKYYDPLIEVADFVSFSDVKIEKPIQVAENLLQKRINFCLITHGSNGSTYVSSNVYFQKSHQIDRIVDTNGAGDTFSASFMLFMNLFKKDIKESMLLASIAAAKTCKSKEIYNTAYTLQELLKVEFKG